MSDTIKAPWTQEQVDALNLCQETHGTFYEICELANRNEDAHITHYTVINRKLRWGALVATCEGWVCPVNGCDYTKDSARKMMMSPAYVDEARAGFEEFWKNDQ